MLPAPQTAQVQSGCLDNTAALNFIMRTKTREQRWYTENTLPCQNGSQTSTLNTFVLGTKGCFHYYGYLGSNPCFQNDRLPCERDSFPDELWLETSNPAQIAPQPRKGVMPPMRPSVCSSDPNCICPSRTVPICIRWAFKEGAHERLDNSHSESNFGLEKLDRKKSAWSTQDICIQILQLFQSNHLNLIKRTLSGRS